MTRETVPHPRRGTSRRAVLFAVAGTTVGLATAVWRTTHAQSTLPVASPAANTAQDTTPKIVAAADAFLATLSEVQRSAARFPYPRDQTTADAAEFPGRVVTFIGEQFGASVWSNYPISDVPRPGVRMGDLTNTQHQAALDLLAATLSPLGYQKVLDIMDADQVLADSGTQYAAGKANYVLGIFGAPSIDERWMWQFGGHHLALNASVDGSALSLVPMLTGCQPATFTRDGQTVRPLGGETDKGFALINALDDAQQQEAILSYAVTDLVLGPGHDGKVLQPEGISATTFNADQRALLLDLVGEWVNVLAAAAAGAKMADIEAHLPGTTFAWSGPTDPENPVYFRVTGPTVHIEFANQGAGGGEPGTVQAGGINHIHTVYRDPTDEYGTGSSQ
jgi:hypothetical protein